MDGLWSSPDLVALIELASLNRASLALSAGWWRVPRQLVRTLAHRARRNTRTGSRRNIAAHYDLGNDFYRLFLDETLTYSSAVFASPDQSLADAQRNKYRIIAERAGLAAAGTCWRSERGGAGSRCTRRRAGLPGDVDHDLAGQWELARERVRAAGLEAWSTSSSGTTARSAERSTRSSRSRCSRRWARSTSPPSSPSATECSRPAAA